MIHWKTCQREFARDGALRDIYVHGTSIDDWQRVLDGLRGRYSLEYWVDGSRQSLPANADEAFKLCDIASLSLRIHTGCILITSHFFTRDEIEFDIDPREVESQATLDELLGFLQFVGDTVCKPVVLSSENNGQRPFITYEPSKRCLQYHGIVP